MAQITEGSVYLWEYKVDNNFMRLRLTLGKGKFTVSVHVAISNLLKSKHEL